MSQNTEKKWLIKNNDIISGPYTKDEITKEWESGNISPFATICLPKQPYWLFITNYPEFSHLQQKTTESTTTSNQLVSQTITATVKKSNVSISNRTQIELKKQPPDNTPKPSQKTYPLRNPPPVSQQQAPLEAQDETKKKINLNFIYYGVAGLSIALMAIFFFLLFTNTPSPQANSNGTQAPMGISYFKSGYYTKAIEYFQNHSTNSEEQILLKILKLQLHNDIDSGKQLIESPTTKISTQEEQMISALIQLKSNDIDSAKDVFIELSQSDSPKEIQTPALNNLILLSAKNGDCIQAGQYIKQGQSNNLNSFALALCIIKSPTANTSQKRTAEKLLKSIIKKKQDYYQESLLVMTYLQKKDNRSADILPDIQTVLNIDPHLTDNHYHDIFVDRTIYSWNELIPLCQNIYDTQKDNKFYIAFYAYCLARFQDYESAKHLIQQSRSKDSEDTLLAALHAYIAQTSHLKEESVLILGNSVQHNSEFNYDLPYILQAQFCETNQDWDCAIDHWLLVLKNKPKSLSALGGIAYSKYQKFLYREAKAYMKRGLESDTDNTYSPMIYVHLEMQNNSSDIN